MRHLHLVPCPLEGVPVTIRARRPEPRERFGAVMKKATTKSEPRDPRGRKRIFDERVVHSTRIVPELYAQLGEAAKAQGVSLNAYVTAAIKHALATGLEVEADAPAEAAA